VRYVATPHDKESVFGGKKKKYIYTHTPRSLYAGVTSHKRGSLRTTTTNSLEFISRSSYGRPPRERRIRLQYVPFPMYFSDARRNENAFICTFFFFFFCPLRFIGTYHVLNIMFRREKNYYCSYLTKPYVTCVRVARTPSPCRRSVAHRAVIYAKPFRTISARFSAPFHNNRVRTQPPTVSLGRVFFVLFFFFFFAV